MEISIYAIRDNKVGGYAPPFFLQNDQVALRAFTGLLMDPQTDVCKHPEDYVLMRIGTFDDVSGAITGEQPEFIGQGSDIAYALRERQIGQQELKV